MAERDFINAIFKLAEKIKGDRLTLNEQNEIIEHFNKSSNPDAGKRAIEAIGKTIGTSLLLEHSGIEKRASFSTDSVEALLQQVNIEAKKWESQNEK